jgi:hypothetical protein
VSSEPHWTSELVEILRFGRSAGSNLREQYLVTHGGDRMRTYDVELTPEEFLDWQDVQRYVVRDPESIPSQLRETVARTVSGMLGMDAASLPRQIDLVLSAKELAALPFELAHASDGRPLLVEREAPVVLTRRVRGEFQEHPAAWPAKPRVLLVASAPGSTIPLQAHIDALHEALRPWVAPLEGVPDLVPDPRNVLHVLEDATLEEIAATCSEGPPYTHVHVLAHGIEVRPQPRQEFGLQLNAPGGGAAAVSGPDFAAALCSGDAVPSVVTLTACDSANVGNTVVSSASVAHAVHAAGIPVVVGSQFPLTFDGSALAAREFYGSLCAGDDVRDALHRARCALYATREQTLNDWGSLAAYVRLPEGYAEQRGAVRLAAALASLETANEYADHVVTVGADATAYGTVAQRLQERIDQLIEWAEDAERHGQRGVLDETRGLVASAHKRLAEVLFRRSLLGDDRDGWRARSRDSLRAAAEWYGRAYSDNMSAHWSAVQALSLEAVLDGEIKDPWRWPAAVMAARTEAAKPDEVWAWGSLAELYLLAPLAGQPQQQDRAADALKELTDRAHARGNAFAIASSLRQFRRYDDWWTRENGFFGAAEDLQAAAKRLIAGADV